MSAHSENLEHHTPARSGRWDVRTSGLRRKGAPRAGGVSGQGGVRRAAHRGTPRRGRAFLQVVKGRNTDR